MLTVIWIDRVRVEFASFVLCIKEGYIPAQHDTGRADLIATHQARCHDFAAEGWPGAPPVPSRFTVEFGYVVSCWTSGDPCSSYAGRTCPIACLPFSGGNALVLGDTQVFKVWAEAVLKCKLDATALRCAF